MYKTIKEQSKGIQFELPFFPWEVAVLMLISIFWRFLDVLLGQIGNFVPKHGWFESSKIRIIEIILFNEGFKGLFVRVLHEQTVKGFVADGSHFLFAFSGSFNLYYEEKKEFHCKIWLNSWLILCFWGEIKDISKFFLKKAVTYQVLWIIFQKWKQKKNRFLKKEEEQK